jgi:hypothetical protein
VNVLLGYIKELHFVYKFRLSVVHTYATRFI